MNGPDAPQKKKKLSFTIINRLDLLIEKSKKLNDISLILANDIVGNRNIDTLYNEHTTDKNGLINDILIKLSAIEGSLDGAYANLEYLKSKI